MAEVLIPSLISWRPPYIAYPIFFKFWPTPPLLPCHLQLPPSLLFGRIGNRATFDVVFYLMILWIYIFRAWMS